VQITVREHTEPDHELSAALARLLPQLSRRSGPPSEDQLRRIVDCPAVQLLCAHHTSAGIVGILALVLIPLPSGVRARIEDVVVDDAFRERGVGRALLREGLDRATAAGARDLDLTSRPGREAAVHLYTTLGFELRQTAVYRHYLGR
jgi:ribosomal protein S18 acetylase RimI-like enzyme